jgi:hypothetical protein
MSSEITTYPRRTLLSQQIAEYLCIAGILIILLAIVVTIITFFVQY